MAMPSFYYLFKNSKKAVYLILALSLFAITIETIGILTGFPYTQFEYTELMGYKLFGLTPITLPFAFVPLVIGSMYFGLKQKNNYAKIAISTLILVLIDLILDPAATKLKIWEWQIQGLYYGVPAINFLGWLFSGLIASTIFVKLENKPLPKETLTSLYLITSFWTGACLWLGLWIPFILGFSFLIVQTKQFLR